MLGAGDEMEKEEKPLPALTQLPCLGAYEKQLEENLATAVLPGCSGWMEVGEGFREEVGRQAMRGVLRSTWWWHRTWVFGQGQCSEMGQVLG